MHAPWLYSVLHRYHHNYKSPQPFDDLFIHPVEAFGYYCILFSPAVLVPNLNVLSFLAYMAVCGVFGVLDHSGVVVQLGPLYDTRAHDVHHAKGFGAGTYVNLAFPFTFMDRLHGTFRAPEGEGYAPLSEAAGGGAVEQRRVRGSDGIVVGPPRRSARKRRCGVGGLQAR